MSNTADTSTIAGATAPPPIVELARVLTRGLSLSYGVLSRTTWAVILSILTPFSLLFSPVAYLLAPLIVSLRVLLDVFIFTPYAIVVSIAHNVYPIYVFVGAACLCALCVGFVARMLSIGVLRLLYTPRRPQPKSAKSEPEVPAPPEPKEKSVLRSSTSKTRSRKRVSIKDERDKYT